MERVADASSASSARLNSLRTAPGRPRAARVRRARAFYINPASARARLIGWAGRRFKLSGDRFWAPVAKRAVSARPAARGCMDSVRTQTSLEPAKSVHGVAGTTVKFEFSLPSVGRPRTRRRADCRNGCRCSGRATSQGAAHDGRSMGDAGMAAQARNGGVHAQGGSGQPFCTATPPFLNAAPRLPPPRAGARRAARVRLFSVLQPHAGRPPG